MSTKYLQDPIVVILNNENTLSLALSDGTLYIKNIERASNGNMLIKFGKNITNYRGLSLKSIDNKTYEFTPNEYNMFILRKQILPGEIDEYYVPKIHEENNKVSNVDFDDLSKKINAINDNIQRTTEKLINITRVSKSKLTKKQNSKEKSTFKTNIENSTVEVHIPDAYKEHTVENSFRKTSSFRETKPFENKDILYENKPIFYTVANN